MKRRYNLARSDNYIYTGRISYICYGSGNLTVYTGFPVTSATVSWVSYPFAQDEEMSSSSDSSLSSGSSLTISSSSSSESSESVSESSTSISMSESSSSSTSEIITGLPRLYVSSYTTTGFVVYYENIPTQVGFIEFEFSCS